MREWNFTFNSEWGDGCPVFYTVSTVKGAIFKTKSHFTQNCFLFPSIV